MIAEAFLIAALAPQPLFMQDGPPEPRHEVSAQVHAEETRRDTFLRAFLLTTEFLGYSERRKHDTSARTLVIDGEYPKLVGLLRDYGIKAFGLDLFKTQIRTPFHAIGQAGLMPFAHESFYVTYWLSGISDPDHWLQILRDAITVVEQGGFFIFSPSQVGFPWHEELLHQNWKKLPFKIHGLEIWQKPFWDRRDPKKRDMRWIFKRKEDSYLPVPQKALGTSA